jgi:chromosome segregation ATPase
MYVLAENPGETQKNLPSKATKENDEVQTLRSLLSKGDLVRLENAAMVHAACQIAADTKTAEGIRLSAIQELVKTGRLQYDTEIFECLKRLQEDKTIAKHEVMRELAKVVKVHQALLDLKDRRERTDSFAEARERAKSMVAKYSKKEVLTEQEQSELARIKVSLSLFDKMLEALGKRISELETTLAELQKKENPTEEEKQKIRAIQKQLEAYRGEIQKSPSPKTSVVGQDKTE